MSIAHKGDVFRMKLTPEEEITPKEKEDTSRNKYFIVLGEDSDGGIIGFSVINTKINAFLSDENKNLHYPLSKDKYSFLEGVNRYVDCSQIKKITKMRFNELFTKNSKKGVIQSDDLDYIIGAIKTSPLVTPKEIKQFKL